MGESNNPQLDELLRHLAAAPELAMPSSVRPGMILADRLEIGRQLGVGGMGRVFGAWDRVRQCRVAVKVLGRLTPHAIVQLKQEFRSVSELVHPNLVRCHELFSDGVEWFFTMDLVDGMTVRAFLDGLVGDARWDALRRVLAQLALALKTLHDAGLLHGDLKPSNFLVTRGDERVVLLDFGLARPIGMAALRGAGTPGYMAPEQQTGDTFTEAIDWYAFGVVLHGTLTGHLPRRERTRESDLEGAPEDLRQLCQELLRDDPAHRPSGGEVLRRLARDHELPRAAPTPALPRLVLIGRDRELHDVEAAYRETLSGKPAIALVLGPSGIGKTSVATAFLRRARQRGCVVLAGRCRERESMPYKAVDGIIDDIAQILETLPPAEAASVLPRHVAELTVLFPVLRESTPIARSHVVVDRTADQTLVRVRAVTAFGELLANLRRRAPLVLWIDDLQWSDVESAPLLGPVVGGADPVPLLLLGACRADGEPAIARGWRTLAPSPTRGPLIDAILAERKLNVAPPTEIVLPPLAPDASEQLALQHLPADAGTWRAAASDIAQEAEGHPLFITELAHASAYAEGRSRAVGSSTLQDLVVRRVAALPRAARRTLEVIAVAGAPLPRVVLRQVQESTFSEAEAGLDLLKTQRLARSDGLKDEDAVDVQHDRVREIVVHGLTESRRKGHHLALARALEARPQSQPDFVAAHYEAAGELARASQHWVAAAEKAARALAFDRAADLYEKAIRHARLSPAAARELHVRRAEALARAGRGPASADVYLAAAEGCPREDAVELRRRAAEQLLLSGHIEKGLEVIEQVLRAIGLRATRGGARGLVSFVLGRLRVSLRGLRHPERHERELSREELVRLDASWTIACSLGLVDFIRGADFQNEHLLLALRAGEPRRLLRALTIEAPYSAAPGIGSERRTARLLAVADELAGTAADDMARALLSVARGLAAYLQGRLEPALVHLDGAAEFLARRGAGAVLEALTPQRFLISTLFFLGRVRRLAQLVPPLLADAEAAGNIYATMVYRTGYSSAVWLARDDERDARAQLERAREDWPATGGFQMPHLNILLGETYVDLYAGDHGRALARLDEQWPRIHEARLLGIAVIRTQLLQLRAACAAAAAADASTRGQRARAGDLRRVARSDSARLRRERVVRAAPWSALVDAALAGSERDDGRARSHLEAAATGFDRLGMQLFASAARVRLGEVTGGAAGEALAREGRSAFAQEGVVNVARMVRMLAPGFPSA